MAIFTGGCSGPSIARLELSSIELDYGFFAVLHGVDRVKRVIPPFGLEDGELIFGAPPALELDPDSSEQVVLVAMTAEDLANSYLGFEVVRAEELAMTVDAASGSFESAKGTIQRGRIPETARTFEVELEGEEASLEPIDRSRLDRLFAMHVPVDPEYCRVPDQSPLEPFTGVERPFQGLVRSGSEAILAVRWLDDDRALVLTYGAIAVVRRGTPLDVGPGFVALPGFLPKKLALDATGARALVLGRSGIAGSAIWAFEVRGDALSALSRHEHPELELEDAAILHDGRQIIAQLGGDLYERDPATGALVAFEQLPRSAAEDDPVSLLALDDPQHPLVATTSSRLHLYSAREQTFSTSVVSAPGLLGIEVLSFSSLAQGRTAEGGLEIWAGAQYGTLFRFRELGWQNVRIGFPPRFSSCPTFESSGATMFSGRITSAALDPSYLHLGLSTCSPVLQVRRGDHCVSLLAPENGVHDGDGTSAIDVRNHRLIRGSLDGSLFSSSW